MKHKDRADAGRPLAAALSAAARWLGLARAVVVRGGAPEQAGELLAEVRAPTLLIAGSQDGPALESCRAALERLRCEKGLVIVPGATVLFEEPGVLEEAARLAAGWLAHHLRSDHGGSSCAAK